MNFKKLFLVLFILLFIFPGSAVADVSRGGGLSTAFTYQGQLKSGDTPYNGVCDFRFDLYNAASGGSPLEDNYVLNTTISEGIFTVQLDYGVSFFSGDNRWLETWVRCPAGSGTYQQLLPRQQLTAVPYALFSKQSNWYGLIGMPAGFADGIDNNTTYTAGDGLDLDGTQFNVTGAPWSGITGMPAGFSDGVDNNTTYTAGDGLELVGTQFKAKGTSYQNVVIVAKSGGDFTSIQAALNSILDASAANPYLVYVAPGIYHERVTMKPFVDIQGSGELTTKITYTGSTSSFTGTVVTADNAEMRFLTVENTGGSTYAVAINNNRVEGMHLVNVTASASGGTYNWGVYNMYSDVTIEDVNVSASGGTQAVGINTSSAESDTTILTDVTASASGAENNYGVHTYSSSTTMTNVNASGSGGSLNIGLYNDHTSPIIKNGSASAIGGSRNMGIYNLYASLTMTNVTVSASGGTLGNIGLYNSVPSGPNYHHVHVNNSQISGDEVTIYNTDYSVTNIGASQLSYGEITGPGDFLVDCIGVYDEGYDNFMGFTKCP